VRNHRAPRSRRADRSGLIWTASSSPFVTITNNQTAQFQVVSMVDDVDIGVGQVEATLLRIRGYFAIIPSGGLVAGGYRFMCGAAVYDDDDVSITNWTAVINYTREDVLWTHGGQWLLPSIIPNDYCPGLFVPIDIKAKRRIKSGQNVRVECTALAPAGASLDVMGVVRGLVKLR